MKIIEFILLIIVQNILSFILGYILLSKLLLRKLKEENDTLGKMIDECRGITVENVVAKAEIIGQITGRQHMMEKILDIIKPPFIKGNNKK